MWRVKTVTKFKHSFFSFLTYWNDNRIHLGIIKKLNFLIWFPPLRQCTLGCASALSWNYILVAIVHLVACIVFNWTLVCISWWFAFALRFWPFNALSEIYLVFTVELLFIFVQLALCSSAHYWFASSGSEQLPENSLVNDHALVMPIALFTLPMQFQPVT